MKLKRKCFSESDLLEISMEFQNLKKENMSVGEYVTIFPEKMELVPHLVPTKHSEIEIFANRLPMDFSPMVK